MDVVYSEPSNFVYLYQTLNADERRTQNSGPILFYLSTLQVRVLTEFSDRSYKNLVELCFLCFIGKLCTVFAG